MTDDTQRFRRVIERLHLPAEDVEQRRESTIHARRLTLTPPQQTANARKADPGVRSRDR